MRSLPSPHFKFMQSSQMAVFSCMRLEDVSDSRCCFLGKLIFQAKLFLFWWSTKAGFVCVCKCVCCFSLSQTPPPLSLRGKDGSDRLQVKRGKAVAAS